MKIQDPENYIDVRVEPMNHKGDVTNGECRIMWLHKRNFDRLARFLDELKEEEWKTQTQESQS